MKRTNARKLALHRETLVSLNADVLADVAGGALTTLTNPPGTRTTGTTPFPTRASCQFICQPQQTRLVCPNGPAQK